MAENRHIAKKTYFPQTLSHSFIWVKKMETRLWVNSTEMLCHWFKWTHACAHTHTHTHVLTHTHWGNEITDGEFSEVGGPGFLGYASDSHYIVLLLWKSLGGHRREWGSRPDASVLTTPRIVYKRVFDPGESPALERDQWCCRWDKPWTWLVFAVMYLFRVFPPKLLSPASGDRIKSFMRQLPWCFHSQLKFYSIPSKGAGSLGSPQQDGLAAINVSSGAWLAKERPGYLSYPQGHL